MFEGVTLRWEGSDRVHYDVVQDRSSDWSFFFLFFFHITLWSSYPFLNSLFLSSYKFKI